MNTLKLEKKNNGIWILTISRPDALNALSAQVLAELSEVLLECEKASFAELRCLILTGSGEKAFVAGADIKEISALNVDSAKKFAELGQSIFRRLENLSVPVIAAVNGFALGGGCELALACDFIYASENAKFGLPEVSLGLIPGFGGTVRLSRVVGLNKAREMTFSGDMISATEALSCGLANKILPSAELLSACEKVAESVLKKGPIAVKMAKNSVQKCFDQNVDAAMQTEALFFAELFKTQDVVEGTQAFIEKRKAQFKGL